MTDQLRVPPEAGGFRLRWTLGKKIGGLAAALLLLMGIMDAYSFLRLRGITREVEEVARHDLRIKRFVRQFASHHLRQRLALERALRSRREEAEEATKHLEAGRREFARSSSLAREALEAAASLAADAETQLADNAGVQRFRTLLGEAAAAHRQSDAGGERVLGLLSQDRRADVRESAEDAEQAAQRVDEIATELVSLADGFIEEDARHATQEVSASRRAMLTFSLAAFAVGVTLSYLLVRRLTLSIAQVSEKAKSIAADVAADRLRAEWLPVPSSDEVGRLVVAFNQMVDGLVEGLAKRKEAEKFLIERVALERSNRDLEEFASIVAHDLKAPLLVVEGFGRRLREKCAEDLSEKGRGYVEQILDGARRTQALISHLLELSRASNASETLVPVDLNAVAQEAVADLGGIIAKTGGRVQLGDLPALEGDPTQLRQLLQNLIGNGLKYHADRPPVVKVYSRRVEREQPSDAAPPVARCDIVVEDNGIGFDEKYLDRIFTPFQRLHSRGEYEGTGLGLAICRKIAERHGGRITARSRVGEGSAFIVTLPLRQPSAGDASEAPRP